MIDTAVILFIVFIGGFVCGWLWNRTSVAVLMALEDNREQRFRRKLDEARYKGLIP